MLRLERCADIARLADESQPLPSEGVRINEEVCKQEAGLWLCGCPTLGDSRPGLGALASELDHKTPSEALSDAWSALEEECGVSAERLEQDQINLAFRRLSQRAMGKGPEPVARFLRVQVWRELVRLDQRDEEADESEDNSEERLLDTDNITDAGSIAGADVEMRRLLKLTELELKREAQRLPVSRLRREVARAEEYAVQLLRFDRQLRAAMEGWSRFDAYRVIGVPRNATTAEVRRAFYRRALQVHPDKGGQTEEFQELQRAYDEVMAERGASHKTSRDDEDESDPQQSKQDGAATQHKQRGTDSQRGGQHETGNSTSSSDCNGEFGSRNDKEKPVEGAASRRPTDVSEELSEDESDDGTNQHADVRESAFLRRFVQLRTVLRQKRKALEQLTSEAQQGAERAGEIATRVLRHCGAMVDMLDCGVRNDQSEAWNSAGAAVQDAARVVGAARTVGKCVGEVAGILEQAIEECCSCQGSNSGVDLVTTGQRLLSAPEVLEDATSAASEAAAAVNSAASECAAAMDEASAKLRKARCAVLAREGPPPDAYALMRVVRPLRDAVREAAVKALEAADACAETCHQARKFVKAASLAAEAAAANPEGAVRTVSEDEAGNLVVQEVLDNDLEATKDGDERGRVGSSEVVNARNALEARRAVAAWMDVHRVLRRADGELHTILRQVRALAKKAGSPVPTLPVAQRVGLSALTAEFLDGAAVDFHATLQKHVDHEAGVDVDLVRAAMASALNFLEAAVPDDDGLACPVDPRAQVIRAASGVDAEGVREMLVQQLPRRLESSVTFVCTTRNSDRGNVHYPCRSSGEAIKVLHEHLATVTGRLFRYSSPNTANHAA